MRLSDIIQNNFRLTSRGLKNDELLQEIQERLAGLGYDPGVADGVMHLKTKAALTQFCMDQRLDCIDQNCYDAGFALKLCGGVEAQAL